MTELKEGFVLQIAPDQYLLGKGPLFLTTRPDKNKWSLFHPPFFYSMDKHLARKAYWYIPSSTSWLSKKNILSLFKTKEEKTLPSIKWHSPSFSLFQNCFSQALQGIKQGHLKKVVPVFFETALFEWNYQRIKTLLYRLLATSSHSGMAYALWSHRKAIMGQTPEYLFQKEATYIHTMALAGTARDNQHNLLQDPKEQKEHEWVVRGIKSALSSLGEFSCLGPYIYSVGPLQHLRTDLKRRGQSAISFQKLCLLLHPTPALGGFPKKPALDLLLEWNQQPACFRSHFGAPFGVSFRNKAFCVVAIRNAQFIDGKVSIGSGCGVVQESHLTTEWQELKKKRNFIKQTLFKST